MNHDKDPAVYGASITFTFTAREWQGLLVLIDLGVNQALDDVAAGRGISQKMLDTMGGVIQPVIDEIAKRVGAELAVGA